MKVSALIDALESVARQGSANKRVSAPATIDAFMRLAELLRASGADELRELRVTRKADDIASLVRKFAEVSRFNKQEWIGLAESNGIKLDLNPRDSARDVMGKLARYLRDHPNALTAHQAKPSAATRTARSTKVRRKLAENLQETLTRLLDD